jgi:Zn-finger nucleic acid-binding protein
MSKSNSSSIPTNTCLFCNGVWIGHEAIEELLKKETKAPSISEIINSFHSQHNKNSNIECPVCEGEELYQIHSHGVELDLCPKCNGLYFDEGELKKVFPRTYVSNNEEITYFVGEGLLWLFFGIFS